MPFKEKPGICNLADSCGQDISEIKRNINMIRKLIQNDSKLIPWSKTLKSSKLWFYGKENEVKLFWKSTL